MKSLGKRLFDIAATEIKRMSLWLSTIVFHIIFGLSKIIGNQSGSRDTHQTVTACLSPQETLRKGTNI